MDKRFGLWNQCLAIQKTPVANKRHFDQPGMYIRFHRRQLHRIAFHSCACDPLMYCISGVKCTHPPVLKDWVSKVVLKTTGKLRLIRSEVISS